MWLVLIEVIVFSSGAVMVSWTWFEAFTAIHVIMHVSGFFSSERCCYWWRFEALGQPHILVSFDQKMRLTKGFWPEDEADQRLLRRRWGWPKAFAQKMSLTKGFWPEDESDQRLLTRRWVWPKAFDQKIRLPKGLETSSYHSPLKNPETFSIIISVVFANNI